MFRAQTVTTIYAFISGVHVLSLQNGINLIRWVVGRMFFCRVHRVLGKVLDAE